MPENVTEAVVVTLARIETKLDGVLSQGADHESRIRKLESIDHDARIAVLEKHSTTSGSDIEGRLRALEKWRFVVMGALAAAGGTFGALIDKFTGG
jgi:hypothetical protein